MHQNSNEINELLLVRKWKELHSRLSLLSFCVDEDDDYRMQSENELVICYISTNIFACNSTFIFPCVKNDFFQCPYKNDSRHLTNLTHPAYHEYKLIISDCRSYHLCFFLAELSNDHACNYMRSENYITFQFQNRKFFIPHQFSDLMYLSTVRVESFEGINFRVLVKSS